MNKIDYSDWKAFSIGKLFDAKNTGNILARDVEDGSGSTPYVTASGINNGVVARIDANEYEIIKGNCILVGGKTFTLTYQAEDFVSNDSHNFVLRLKREEATENIQLYLLTVLRCALSQKYSWDDAVTKEKILQEEILLPAKNDEPDWSYMEEYIQKIKTNSVSPKIDILSKLLSD